MSPKAATKTSAKKSAKTASAKKAPAAKPAKAEASPKPEVTKTKPETAGTKPVIEAKPKKLGCVDAAAQVLAETQTPMTSKELIAAMAAKNLWTSPAGQTPHATLYSAILREISGKGSAARFVKAERGKFAAPGVLAAAG